MKKHPIHPWTHPDVYFQHFLMQFIITYSFASSYVKIFSVGWIVGRLGEKVPVLAMQAQADYLKIL